MSSGARVDPYPNHRFEVDVDRDGIAVTGFSEVRGLSVAVESDRTGSSNGWVDIFERDARGAGRCTDPVLSGRRPTESPRLELRRGVTDDTSLWDWFQRWIDGTAEPADVRVILLDSTGARARTWVCKRARPVRWRGPTLTATESGVAMERYELAHDGIALADVE